MKRGWRSVGDSVARAPSASVVRAIRLSGGGSSSSPLRERLMMKPKYCWWAPCSLASRLPTASSALRHPLLVCDLEKPLALAMGVSYVLKEDSWGSKRSSRSVV